MACQTQAETLRLFFYLDGLPWMLARGLSLKGNQLSGTIPSTIIAMTKLTYVRMTAFSSSGDGIRVVASIASRASDYDDGSSASHGG